MITNKLKKLAKKVNLSVEDCQKIIIINHELSNLIPKKELKSVNINFEDKTHKTLNNIAKTLKVSISSVISFAILNGIEETKQK